MLDHLLIYSQPELMGKTVNFYLAVLGPLGYTKKASYMDDAVVGLGHGTGHADFWITSTAIKPDIQPGYAHFAFSAKDCKTVDDCFAKGVGAGGKDNGPPGERAMYGPGYYGGFLLDPVGNNMEIVVRPD